MTVAHYGCTPVERKWTNTEMLWMTPELLGMDMGTPQPVPSGVRSAGSEATAAMLCRWNASIWAGTPQRSTVTTVTGGIGIPPVGCASSCAW